MEDYVGIEPFVHNAEMKNSGLDSHLLCMQIRLLPAIAKILLPLFSTLITSMVMMVSVCSLGIEGETTGFDKDGMPRFTEYVTNN